MPGRIRHFVVALLAALPMAAQTPSATVVGRVTDPTGAVVPGAAVRIANLDTNQSSAAASNGAGDFTAPYLNPGRYALAAEANGFRAYKLPEFTLQVDQELRIDIKLEVGAASETVTVTDVPSALNTESGARGDVTVNAEIVEMPLNGRNFTDLAFLTGGVVPPGAGADGQFPVNGARADNVSLLVDGMNNTQRRNTGPMVSPPLESIQEFKMITSGFSAEYGRFAGGVLSMVTKTGTNRVRGSLYEFLRNDVLDARNFFSPGRTKLIQNQFGATVSGPVVLPKLYNGRDRTFFLISWESLRQISAATQLGVVPSPQMLQGNFSGGKTIVDPLNKSAPFPANQIPQSRFDPVSTAIGAFYPAPSLPGAVNNYLAQGDATSRFDTLTAKVDHSIGSKDRLTVNGFWNPSNSLNPFEDSLNPIFGAPTNQTGILAGIREIHMFTPLLFNEASISYSRETQNQGILGSDHDWDTPIGFAGVTQNPADRGLPSISVSGYIDLGEDKSLPKIWSYNNYQYTDAATWIHGRHSMKFGGDYLHYQYYNHYYSYLRGAMSFLGRFTNDPMADFVLGYAQSSNRLLDVGKEYILTSNYSAFVQDDFKIAPTLTLNIGLRYELMKQPIEKYGEWSTFVPALGKIAIAGMGPFSPAAFSALIQQTGMAQYITSAAAVGLPPSLIHTNYHNFAPRFGFAWRPFGNTRTAIRGGYGIFYGTDSLNRYAGLNQAFPFLITQSFSAVTSNPLLLTPSNPFPAAQTKTGGVTSPQGEPVDNPTQYLQTWNLTVERDLGGGVVLEMAYAGSKGTHLPREYDINQQLPIKSLNFPRPFPAFSTINFFSDVSNSAYNSGSVTLRRRLSRQLFLRATYVYAKSIDESSNTGGSIAAGFPTAQDSRDLNAERGRSDFDVGHAFAASFIRQPNVSRNLALRNWQISGTTTAYTGVPFTPKVANFSLTTGGAARPDRIAKGTVANPSAQQWYDIGAFPPVPVGAFQFGTSGRNILDGPGSFSLNTALSRRFRLAEAKALQVRWEAFNLTNRTNFNLPQTDVDVPNAATITQAKAPRQMQLALRLEF